MKSFEDIMDNLDTLVSEGKLSEESASSIADSFYDKYVVEKGAFDRALNIYASKGLPEYTKGNYEKAKLIAKKTGFGYNTIDEDDVQRWRENEESRHSSRNIHKRHWAKDNGDDGKSPEERYKAGRYEPGKMSYLQKEGLRERLTSSKEKRLAKESSLEDEINGLGIACEAGLISEDFLPILLEAVDSYLD